MEPEVDKPSNSQNPQPTQSLNPESATSTESQSSQPSTAAPVRTDDSTDQKSRLAMILFATMLAPLGAARVYIGDKTGMIRFWVFVASVPLAIIPVLNILAVLSMFALQVWGLIDFFLLKDRKTDELGKPLATTNRDERFIKYLVIYFIAAIVLSVLVFVVVLVAAIVLTSAGINSFEGAAGGNFNSNLPSGSLNSI